MVFSSVESSEEASEEAFVDAASLDELLLSELEDCVPAQDPVDRVLEAKELGEVITSWLQSLPAADQNHEN